MTLTRHWQFHWQDYSDKNYLTALRHMQDLQREGKIVAIGLCNFDAIRTDEICTELGPGAIVSNQVQVLPLPRPQLTCETNHSFRPYLFLVLAD